MSEKIINIVSVLVSAENKVLVLKRSKDSVRNPGKWELAGGKLDFGESYEEAASRELFEETNISTDFSSKQIASTHKLTDGDFHFLTVVFHLNLNAKPEIELSNEHEKYVWLTERDIDKYDYSSDEYVEYLKKHFARV